MKFISNFCLYLIGIVIGLTIGSVIFESNVSIYSWVSAIGLAIVTTLISNHYGGKHDE